MTWQRLPRTQRAALIAGGVAAALAVFWLLVRYWPDGVDWYYHFYPDTRLYMAGGTRLYDENTSFFHAPWSIWLLMPFAALPFRVGQALLWLATAAMIAWGAVTFTPPGRARAWGLAFALFNLHTFDHLYRGQMTAFDVPGIALGWLAIKHRRPWLMAAGLWLLTANPPNTIPIALFFMWVMLRRWTLRELAQALLPLGLTFLLSLPLFGLWPIRWVISYQASPLGEIFAGYLTTLWRFVDQVGLPPGLAWGVAVLMLGCAAWAWHRIDRGPAPHSPSADLDRLVLVLIFTFVVTPFSQSYRLIALVAVAAPFIAGWKLWPALLLHLLTFTPLVRLIIGEYNGWVDYIYVFVMWIIFLAYLGGKYRPAASAAHSQPLPGTQPLNQPLPDHQV